LASARLESLREGNEVCEARIFLEDALLDDSKKAKLGTEFAKRSQDALDEHHRAMWKTAWNNDEDLKLIGVAGGNRNPQEGLWSALAKAGKTLPEYWSGPAFKLRHDEAEEGQASFAKDWQAREEKLFVLAGEAASKLGPYQPDKPGLQVQSAADVPPPQPPIAPSVPATAASKPQGSDSTPAIPEQVDLVELRGRRQEWPREVTLLQKTTFPVVIGGKVSGSVDLLPGTIVQLISAGPEVEVQFHDAKMKLPANQTDLVARVSACRKGGVQKQMAP
jgi:hypothetical protein